MKKDKRLQSLIKKISIASFDAQGDLEESKVKKYLGNLKNFPPSKALSLTKDYLKGLKSDIEKRTLFIESAVALSTDQVEQIKKSFKGSYPVASVQANLNPSLLGGIRLKMSDVVFDDSISNKIERLKGIHE